MTVAEMTRFAHEEIKPSIGSRILNTKEELLAGDLGPQIRELLEQRGVLVFPKINFTDEEQIAFTKTLGTFAPEIRDGGDEKIHKITLDVKENPQSAEYLKGSLYWHIDGTMNEVPILASLLSCKVPATWGGNTGFCNTYAAYEALTDEQKAEYEKLRVVHSVWATVFYYEPEPSLAKIKGMQAIGENELPLVWNHKSGRKSLVLGCTAHRVTNVTPMKSAEILVGLREWATREEFSYSHEWSVGDLVIWDNTGTMHRAEKYDPDCNRMMHRTKLQGEEPFE
ncbi:TauD/TfdA family dioxygenase [Sphingomonas sp. LaA6.9]|uniref:TauD/TfdA dioxygenase family protein n=1 Tax=Sphingomonas sp. LaA6.9 TaxID=2919914 RepID=UPI001F5013C2|nr:TauD/TfdA family dioxygenase [Sphingomonas sp. LaA6.9]MCJ8156109.1 TauD/TfdA family dioxygenase [Sphingomonas sp. LaA6.9]